MIKPPLNAQSGISPSFHGFTARQEEIIQHLLIEASVKEAVGAKVYRSALTSAAKKAASAIGGAPVGFDREPHMAITTRSFGLT